MCVLCSERANKTIKRPSHDGGEGEELRGGGDAGCLATASQDDRGGWNQKSQSEAGEQRRSQRSAAAPRSPRSCLVSRNSLLGLCVAHLCRNSALAVNQLKSLLMKQCKEIPQVVSPSRKQSPSKVLCVCVCVFCSGFCCITPANNKPILIFPFSFSFDPQKPAVNHYQSESVQPLEAEVKFCKVCII